MSQILLIRHAQAGARDNYDVLSDLGREQAEALSGHFALRDIRFQTVYTGGMNRQRLTAEIACSKLTNGSAPEIISDPRWNEFSLAEVYRAIAPRMIAESEEFARDFSEMQEALRKDPHTTRGPTGRCDAAVIRAWMENRFPEYRGEPWLSFRNRIRERAAELLSEPEGGPIAIFTSATPIAILAAAALDISDERLLSILGVLYNAGVTVMRPWRGELRLFTFNSASHLPPGLCTFR